MRHPSLPVTSRTNSTRTGDGNGDPPPRSRKPGAHRAPPWSSCRPPCFHLRGRGSKDARTKHVTMRPSGPEAARRSSSVAGARSRKGAVTAAIGCRNTPRSPREPLSRFGRFAAICTDCPDGSGAARRSRCPSLAVGLKDVLSAFDPGRDPLLRPKVSIAPGEPAGETDGTRPGCTEAYSIEPLTPCNQPRWHDRERRRPPRSA